MTLKYYLIIIVWLIFLIGCNPDSTPPIDRTGDPIFEVAVIIDGEAKTWTAGIDNQFMYPFTTTDSNSIVHFQGNLGLSNCQDCPNSINFDFVQAQNFTSINTLFNDDISYRNTVVDIDTLNFTVAFKLDLNGIAPYIIDWDFGDGTTLSNSNQTVEHVYNNAGIYNVCVDIIDGTGCSSTLCREISTDNKFKCSVNFQAYNEINSSNTFLYYSYSAGVPPFDYQWNIPVSQNQFQSFVVASPTIFINQLFTGIATVDLMDDEGCNCSASQSVDYQSINNSCSHFFEYNSKANLDIGDLPDYFSTLNIQYIDDNGIIYQSSKGEQPNFSTIEILKIEDFEPSPDNLNTKKIELGFVCRLFDNNGNHIDITNGTAIIAVAYE